MWWLRWALFAGLWLALTDTRVLPELVTGAVVAAIGATVASLVTRPGRPRTVRNSLALLGLGPRRLGLPLLRLVVDTALLTAALWRRLVRREQVRGAFRETPRPRQEPLRTAAGRAALEVWGSLAPNRYVVGVDDERGVVVVHELVRSDLPLEPLGSA
jgi:multisubunit Na+/H+ antiporter MnhE subunit